MKTSQSIWFNGCFLPWAEANVHVMSHALHYGSSVFEGIRCYATPKGPANLINAIPRRALLKGFIILDHMDRAAEASQAMGAWMQEGRLVAKTYVREGLESAPAALQDLFTGANLGKTLVRV